MVISRPFTTVLYVVKYKDLWQFFSVMLNLIQHLSKTWDIQICVFLCLYITIFTKIPYQSENNNESSRVRN